jgi:alkylated DNA repair dioxygenase AlkB
MQLPLFDDGQQIVVDDHHGFVQYLPHRVAYDTAQSWFDDLLAHVNWQGDRRLMYEREVDVPRLMASYRLDDADLPAPIRNAAALVNGVVAAPFNSVGLNLYRDGRDSVALHNDRLGEIEPGQPIVLLSLGGTRRMTIAMKDKSRRPIHLDLQSGSVLVMNHASQLHLLHGIPKMRGLVQPRISLAFRVRTSLR